MANNDIEVIIYKISSHLYESIKLWHKTCLDDIAWRYKLWLRKRNLERCFYLGRNSSVLIYIFIKRG